MSILDERARNRKIRFRIWEKNKKHMLDDVFIKNELILLNDIFKLDNYDFMQCIDLNDENGKEIYEGDILRFSYLPGNLEKLVTNSVVTWKSGNFVIKSILKNSKEFGDSYYGDPCHFYHPIPNNSEKGCRCKIIGNIYETPELAEYF